MSIRARLQRHRRVQDDVLHESQRTTSPTKATREQIIGRVYVIEDGHTVFTAHKIIAEEGDWVPSKLDETPARKVGDLLGVPVVGYELELRDKVKRARGRRRPRQCLWELPHGQIMALGLEDRIIKERV